MKEIFLATALLGLSALQSAQAAPDSVAYAYDAYGRVATVTYANGTVITYQYDTAGNRNIVSTVCSPTGC